MSEAQLTIKIDGKNAEKDLRKLEQAFQKLDGQGKQSQDKLNGLGGVFSKIGVAGKVAAAGVGVALVGALKTGVESSIAFEKSMGEISTLLSDDFAGGTDAVKAGIEQITAQFGGDLQTNAQAAYSIISAGASDASEAITLLEASNKLAIGGVTDVATAADGLTSALNSYEAGAEEASRYSDIMFAAMQGGKTTIGELAAVMGNTAPLAAQLGIGFDELQAATAALTTTGLQTSVAGTQLTAVMSAMLAPGKAAQEMADELGIQFDAQALKSQGLAKTLEIVKEATGGNEAQMQKLFGSMEAVKAVTSLTGKQQEAFKDILFNTKNAAGLTEEAFTKMSGNVSQQWAVLTSKTKVLITQLADRLLPVFINVIDFLSNTIPAAYDTSVEAVTDFIEAIAGMATDVADFVTGMIDAIKEQFGFLTGIFDTAGEAIDDVTGYFKGMWDKVTGNSYVPDMVEDIAYWFGTLDTVMVQPAKTTTEEVTGVFKDMGEDVVEGFEGMFEDFFKTGKLDFKSFADDILGIFTDLIAKIAAEWTTKSIFSGSFDIGGLLGDIGGAISGATGGIKSAIGAITGLGAATKLTSSQLAQASVNGGAFADKLLGLGNTATVTTGELAAADYAAGNLAGEFAGLETVGTNLGSSVLPALGFAAVGVGAAMAFSSRKSARQAEIAEDVRAKFQEATDVINTGALTWGVWGDEGLIALNDVNGGAQLFRDTMQAAGVTVHQGADGMALLGDATESTRQMALAYNNEVAAGLQTQIDLQIQKQGLNDQDNSDRAAILEVEKDITEEWQKSLDLINSSEFSAVVAEFDALGIAAEGVFEDISADGMITRDELKTHFGEAADGIITEMGSASSITVTKLNEILGIGKGAASGVEGGFRDAADSIAGDMKTGVGIIQDAINGLQGVEVHSSHIIHTRHTREDINDAQATGTPEGGLVVPSGFPNDSFTLGLTSGERYYVDTPSQQRAREKSSNVGSARIEMLLERMVEQNEDMKSELTDLQAAVYSTGEDNKSGHEDTKRILQENAA